MLVGDAAKRCFWLGLCSRVPRFGGWRKPCGAAIRTGWRMEGRRGRACKEQKKRRRTSLVGRIEAGGPGGWTARERGLTAERKAEELEEEVLERGRLKEGPDRQAQSSIVTGPKISKEYAERGR